MGLSGIVHDGVYIVFLESRESLLWVGNVTVLEGKIWLVVQRGSVVSRRTVVEFVVRDDVVLWVL